MGTGVMVMAGGTGGHVYPALAVADEMRRRGLDVAWLGSEGGFEVRVVVEAGYPLEPIRVKGLRGSGVMRLLQAPYTLAVALWQTRQAFVRRRPGLVLGMGGFVTGPGGVMARLMGIPLVIHEQNAIPGLTNRLLSRIADRVLEAFPHAFGPKAHARTLGNPVRGAIAALPCPAERLAGRAGPLRLLVLGGSLGAAALNRCLPQALARLPAEVRPEVRHQAGRDKDSAAREAYVAAGIEAEVTAFIQDMGEAYAWADFVIARAGALTLTELTAAGLGAILVPYPYAVDDHQTHNARSLVEAGAARLIQERDLTPEGLAEEIGRIDRPRALEMATAARALARPDAVNAVVDACLEVMRR